VPEVLGGLDENGPLSTKSQGQTTTNAGGKGTLYMSPFCGGMSLVWHRESSVEIPQEIGTSSTTLGIT
jgi:hypothetical protein